MREIAEELLNTLDEEVRQRLVRILDTFTCGVLAESRGRILFANEKLAHMLTVERHSLWGTPTRELVPEELCDVFDEEARLAEKGDLRARLAALQVRDGSTTAVLVLPMSTFETRAGDRARFDVVIDLGAVMTAKHACYEGESQVRAQLTRIALELQIASVMAGNIPAANPELRHPVLDELSKREREVLARLVEGQRVPSIAEQLFISQHTVRNHLKSIFRKLDVGSQAELIERVRELR
jgi:DNA-binding CsgD family transcriptional regulator